jgi:hypothetical protein
MKTKILNAIKWLLFISAAIVITIMPEFALFSPFTTLIIQSVLHLINLGVVLFFDHKLREIA